MPDLLPAALGTSSHDLVNVNDLAWAFAQRITQCTALRMDGIASVQAQEASMHCECYRV